MIHHGGSASAVYFLNHYLMCFFIKRGIQAAAPWHSFCSALLKKKSAASMDWYPWMVVCDALCLVLISFFYSMIGQGGTGNVLLDVQV